jgi:hypothetical protein
MPLLAPILDDRSYQQLRDELVRRIPVYTPEWTDHNPSDPGITLIELFAFLGENLLFRFNQIPDATKLGFLRLLQIPLRPRGVAQGVLALTTTKPAQKNAPGPAANLFDRGSICRAGAVSFETLNEVTVHPVSLKAIARHQRPLTDLTVDEREWSAPSLQARGVSAADAGYYVNQTVPADPMAPGAAPVDFSQTVDKIVWCAVLNAPDNQTVGDAYRQLLRGHTLNVGIVLDEEIGPIEIDVPSGELAPCDGVGPPRLRDCNGQPRAGSSPSEVTWQISTGQYDDPATRQKPRYAPLSLVEDTTHGLTRSGVVRLALPDAGVLFGDFVIDDPDLRGTGDLPPLLEDEKEQARLLFWLRAFRHGGERPIGRIVWVGANAVEVLQAVSAPPELIGVGSAQPNQTFQLVNDNVLKGTVVLEVEEGTGSWTSWSEVDSFDASREDDRHFLVLLEEGRIVFGNTVKGYAPQIGQRIRVTSYRYGGGAQGNLPAGALTKIQVAPQQTGGSPTGIKAQNPLPLRGGSEAESMREALDRIPGELRRRDRAVTTGDFRELALATPGASVGRAEVLPLFCPRLLGDDVEAPGAVTVVVWPQEDSKHPQAPMPDRTTLRQVCAWLDARRLVTTELWVIPPTYVRVAVSVGVKVKQGYGADAVRRWVELVLHQYLAPLPPYGPEGQGWPLGRVVHGPELEAAVLQVEGVEFLVRDSGGCGAGLRVAGESNGAWVEGPVQLSKWQVPELAQVTVVTDRPPGAPQDGLAPPPPDKTPVAVPTIKEDC